MKIIIGADIKVSEENKDKFESGKCESLVGEKLASILKEADFRIFNLETAVGSKGGKIKKAGPHLLMSEAAFAGVSALNPTVLSISNNHVMDYGYDGLRETIRIIKDNNILYVGAGENIYDAKCGLTLEQNGIRVAIYSCAEHEFSIASDKTAGCNPYDPLYSFDDVKTLKAKSDYVIVLYHGNKELYRYPSPNVQRVCRKFAESGADVVVCQHSHCIGASEKYQGAELVYGQGNFIMYSSTNEFYQTGLLIQIELLRSPELKSSVRYIPIHRDGTVISLAEESQGLEILQQFEERSNQIKSDDFVASNYQVFAKMHIREYLACCLGGVRNNFWFKVFNKLSKGKLIDSCYKDSKTLIGLLNTIECEAHRELFIAALKDKINGEE